LVTSALIVLLVNARIRTLKEVVQAAMVHEEAVEVVAN
jgi:hypothetical protein